MAFVNTAHFDPMVAVDGGGNCLPGPYLPFSLVRLGPDCALDLVLGGTDDTKPIAHSTNGYHSEAPIRCFSHLHVSGTGGGGRYGNIGVMPFGGAGRLWADPQDKADETAAAGYYSVRLRPSDIHVELTSTPRVGLHRYRFPAQGQPAHLLFDLGQCVLRTNSAPHLGNIGGFVEVTSPTELVGRGDYRGGWGHTFPYSVFFAAKVSTRPVTWSVGQGGRFLADTVACGPQVAALASFAPGVVVELRVGISFVSIGHARASLRREAPPTKSFDIVRAEAVATWEKAFGSLRVAGPNEADLRLFYSMFGRLLCMPGDLGVDDEFCHWRSGVRHYNDFYCLWDSARNANSLLLLIEPEAQMAQLRCLLDIAEHTGWLPDAWILGHSASIQGGSSADLLFCEAHLKGFTGFDYAAALEASVRNSSTPSPDPKLYGRFPQKHPTEGYLLPDVINCVSRTLEYATQDAALACLASRLGQPERAAELARRATVADRLWRPEARCYWPRDAAGRWVEPLDPWRPSRPDFWNDPHFYEGTAHDWALTMLHQAAMLVDRHGGPAKFSAHLDEYLQRGPWLWKEIILHTPWLYHWAGQPGRSSQQARACLRQHYAPTRTGLADNEDMGSQSAYVLATMAGLYPVPAHDLYLLGAPAFPEVDWQLPQGQRPLRVRAPGASDARPCIASAKLNGRSLDRAWLTHAEVLAGGDLELELSATPTAWATASVPPPRQTF